MSELNPYQPPTEKSELIKPAIEKKPINEETPTYAQEALYFAGVAGLVFLLTFGAIFLAQFISGL